jgi:hypothetical protein
VRQILKFSLPVLIAIGGYLFWPRNGSLSTFDAAAIAELHVGAWRHAAAGDGARALLDHYGIPNGQHRMAPVPAMSASMDMLRAQRAFAEAADQADEERALPFLEKAFSIIGEKTGTNLDPAILARLELFSWSLPRGRSKESQLAAAISEKLALLHGGAAQDYESAASDFAQAKRLVAAQNWSAAVDAEASGWEKLRRQIDSGGSRRSSQL